MFGKGISASGSLLDASLKYELINKSGSWYSYGEERIGQGRENAKAFIESNPDVSEDLEKKLRELIFPEIVPPAELAEDEKPADKTNTEKTKKPADEKAPAEELF